MLQKNVQTVGIGCNEVSNMPIPDCIPESVMKKVQAALERQLNDAFFEQGLILKSAYDYVNNEIERGKNTHEQ